MVDSQGHVLAHATDILNAVPCVVDVVVMDLVAADAAADLHAIAVVVAAALVGQPVVPRALEVGVGAGVWVHEDLVEAHRAPVGPAVEPDAVVDGAKGAALDDGAEGVVDQNTVGGIAQCQAAHYAAVGTCDPDTRRPRRDGHAQRARVEVALEADQEFALLHEVESERLHALPARVADAVAEEGRPVELLVLHPLGVDAVLAEHGDDLALGGHGEGQAVDLRPVCAGGDVGSGLPVEVHGVAAIDDGSRLALESDGPPVLAASVHHHPLAVDAGREQDGVARLGSVERVLDGVTGGDANDVGGEGAGECEEEGKGKRGHGGLL